MRMECCVHQKKAQTLIKSGTAVCYVEVRDTTVTQAGPCFKTNLADVQLSSTVVGRKENTLTM